MSISLGPLPIETSAFRTEQRRHQAWWRAAILQQPAGQWPRRPGETIGSCLAGGETTWANFWPVEDLVQRAYQQTKDRQKQYTSGMLNESRFFNNLLSSQPLAFFAFAIWLDHPELAARWLRHLLGKEVKNVQIHFEFAGRDHPDRSAWDVAFRFDVDGQPGVFGLECKYTDDFSKGLYGAIGHRNYETYKTLAESSPEHFQAPYNELAGSRRYNQLFRGELVGLHLREQNPSLQVWTGLFYHQADQEAELTGSEFKQWVPPGRFVAFTYQQYHQALVEAGLPEQLHQWADAFVARYCNSKLSMIRLNQTLQLTKILAVKPIVNIDQAMIRLSTDDAESARIFDISTDKISNPQGIASIAVRGYWQEAKEEKAANLMMLRLAIEQALSDIG